MIGKSCGSTIILVAITVVLIGIVLTVSQTATVNKNVDVEKFMTLDHTKKELKELNDLYRVVGCQRNVQFVNHPDSNLSVSERAYREQSDYTCPTNLNVKVPSADFYEIVEAEMKYNLKSKCFNISVTKIWQRSSSQVQITFPTTSFAILKEMLYLNPIFFEFNKSSAYALDSRNMRIYFTDLNNTLSTTLTFNLVPNNGTVKYSFNTNGIDGASIQDITVSTSLSCTVYYLELHDTSSEKIQIAYNGDKSQRVHTHVVFDKNYLVTVTKNQDGFYFHQKMDYLITNQTPPVMTVKFSFNLTKNKEGYTNTWVYHEIFKVYMDTSYGSFNGLPYWESNQYRMLRGPESAPLNNMFSFWVMSTESNNRDNWFEFWVSLPSQWTNNNLWLYNGDTLLQVDRVNHRCCNIDHNRRDCKCPMEGSCYWKRISFAATP